MIFAHLDLAIVVTAIDPHISRESAGNFNGCKNCLACARSKILDALILATPEASPVSSTQHIHLSLNNPSMHFSKHGLAFDQSQTDLFGPDS